MFHVLGQIFQLATYHCLSAALSNQELKSKHPLLAYRIEEFDESLQDTDKDQLLMQDLEYENSCKVKQLLGSACMQEQINLKNEKAKPYILRQLLKLAQEYSFFQLFEIDTFHNQ